MEALQQEMRNWRDKWDITQEKAGRAMKIAHNTWSEWERGKKPKPANTRRLHRLFEKNPHELPG